MQWVLAPGIPADAVLPTSTLSSRWMRRAALARGQLPAKKLDTRDWMTPQWRYFLDGMPAALRKEQLADLDQAFGLTRSECAMSPQLVDDGDPQRLQPSYPRLEEYLKTIGRRKLIVPLYEELMKTPAGAAFAKRVYAQARPGYHPLHRRGPRSHRQPRCRGCGDDE